MPELFAQTFADLGERMEDHLDLRRIDPTYRIHFRDGSSLTLTSDLNKMQAQLEAFEPGSFGAYLRYLNEGHRHYKLALAHLVGRNFRTWSEFFNPKNLLLFLRLKGLTRHYDNVGNYFVDPRLKAAFSFQNVYVGVSPYEAPAVFSLLQYTELADGVWFPMGGMYRVVEVLTGIAERWGVRFLYNAPVIQINVDGGRATGATLADGQRIRADVVVANADLPYVYSTLLRDDGVAHRLERKKYGCSALMFYWSLDKQYLQFGPHNLFLAGDDRHSFNQVFNELTLPDDPSFYIHAPARVDPSLAPEGRDTLTAAIPVGHIDGAAPQNWAALKTRAQQVVLQRLKKIGVRDLEAHITSEVSYTPYDWRSRYNLVKGSTHGLSHHLLQLGYLRPRNRHARHRNLYFVGASTHPGTGLPAVLVSARLATERVMQEIGTPREFLMAKPNSDLQRRGFRPNMARHHRRAESD
jgi:phytoene desaturase